MQLHQMRINLHNIQGKNTRYPSKNKIETSKLVYNILFVNNTEIQCRKYLKMKILQDYQNILHEL